MKAPEKIYLQACGDCMDNDCKNCTFEDLEENATWCRDRIFEKDIEYTRTDAFIEKACEWLKDNAGTYHRFDVTENRFFYNYNTMINDFKKAMEI